MRDAAKSNTVRVMNIVGIFVESVKGGDIVGRLTYYPGLYDPNAEIPDDNWGFLRSAVLVR